jgi:class 3 adenylate cyclase
MRTSKPVRQSVRLPANLAAQVRSMANSRQISANRMFVELVKNGIRIENRKQREFFEAAERFRTATRPKAAKRLGEHLGRIIFGG